MILTHEFEGTALSLVLDGVTTEEQYWEFTDPAGLILPVSIDNWPDGLHTIGFKEEKVLALRREDVEIQIPLREWVRGMRWLGRMAVLHGIEFVDDLDTLHVLKTLPRQIQRTWGQWLTKEEK
jgi:hypothetical protein